MRYIKDGKFATHIISLNGYRIINPTHEQYIDAGYEVYEEPIYIRTLDDAKNEKIQEVNDYYDSDDINLVNISGYDIYLGPEIRLKINERIESAKFLKKENLCLSFNEVDFELTTNEAEFIMAKIIDQYGMAYDIKSKKIKAIKLLETIQEVDEFDAISDYPEKLVLM